MLTFQQQELTSRHHNLIYKCLSKMNIPYKKWDDYYGVCAEGLCLAAEKYNDSKSKFSTLAMDIMERKMIDEIRRTHCEKRGKGIERIGLEDGKVIYDCENNYYEFEHDAITRCTLSELLKLLNRKEREIIKLIYEGFTYEETADKLNISKAAVGKNMKKIRRLYCLHIQHSKDSMYP